MSLNNFLRQLGGRPDLFRITCGAEHPANPHQGLIMSPLAALWIIRLDLESHQQLWIIHLDLESHQQLQLAKSFVCICEKSFQEI